MTRELIINTSPLAGSLRTLLETSKRDSIEVMREQARGVIRRIVDITPPAGKNVHGDAARQRGQRLVVGDILRVVRGVPPPLAQEQDVKAVLARYRVKGRVRRGANPRILVPMDALRAYIAQQKSHVGLLASGWKTAAEQLGIVLPQWIGKHDGEGGFELEANADHVVIRFSNQISYASEADMNARVNWAIASQEAAIQRRLDYFFREVAAKSGLKLT